MIVVRSIAGVLLVLCLALGNQGLAQETNSQPITIHVVQRGETLFHIAQHYGVTVEAIVEMNNLPNAESLQVGQRLLIPVAPQTVAAVSQTHTVQPGETLDSIARAYNTDIETLAQLNQITNVDAIYVGQVLIVEGESTLNASVNLAPEPVDLVYVVQPGETLFRIAMQFDVSVNDLMTANQIDDPMLIYAGQQLIIPDFVPPQLALGLPAPITAIDLMPEVLIEGETGRLRLDSSQRVTVTGTFLDTPLNFASNGTSHMALFGIPLGISGNVYRMSLTITSADGTTQPLTVNVQVVGGGYGVETIQLMEGRDNLLDPNVEAAELEILRRVMTVFNPERMFDGPFSLPAAATITSFFGVTRSYNGGEFNRIHYGTDFAGVPGTPVLAAAPGRVVLADTLNVRGNATVIDHGWGVYSGYWHQQDQFIQLGDRVTTGQVIGTIGATGRVTGAHLHWEVWVGGMPVNPMQWVNQSFP